MKRTQSESYIWSSIGNATPASNTFQELREALQQELDLIPHEIIQKLI